MFFRRSISYLNAASNGRSSEMTWALQLILKCNTASNISSASFRLMSKYDEASTVSSELHSGTLWDQFSVLCAEQRIVTPLKHLQHILRLPAALRSVRSP